MNSGRDRQPYDRGVSMFSPEGRIHQVEYARQAVENGAPILGVRAENGVVLSAIARQVSELALSTQKLHRVSGSIGAATTGYVPDGRKLIDDLRVGTQQEKIRYGGTPEVEAVTKQIADNLQESTQVGGRRPFGSSLIVAGVDEEGPQLFAVDPGGTPGEWLAVADGSNRGQFLDFFEQHYERDFTVDEAVGLSVDALEEVSDQPTVDPQNVSVAVVTTEDEQYRNYTEEELQEYTGE